MVKSGSAADVDVQVDHGGVVRRQVDGEVSERLVSTSTGTVSSPSYTQTPVANSTIPDTATITATIRRRRGRIQSCNCTMTAWVLVGVAK
jgi:hypothetical protein